MIPPTSGQLAQQRLRQMALRQRIGLPDSRSSDAAVAQMEPTERNTATTDAVTAREDSTPLPQMAADEQESGRQIEDKLLILDLDTFLGSERFIEATALGAAFSTAVRSYLNSDYGSALSQFKWALIAAYVEGDDETQIWDRERAIIHIYLGNCYSQLEEWEAAEEEYRNALSTEGSLAEGHYNLGVALRASGRLDEAIESFSEALRYDAYLYEARFALGRSFYELSDYGRAYIAYTVARQLRPDAAEPLYYLGLVHQAQGDTIQADKCFAEALLIDPSYGPNLGAGSSSAATMAIDTRDLTWHYRLAEELKSRGNLGAAMSAYQDLLQEDPSDPRAYYLLANLYARQRQWKEAIAEYEVALRLDPGFTRARHKLGLALREVQRLSESYENLMACARQERNDGAMFLSLGLVLLDLGGVEQAVSAFTRTVQLLPDDPQGYYYLGRALIRVGLDNHALRPWRRAVELDPRLTSARFDLGVLLLQQSLFEEAVGHFQAVLNAQPGDIDTIFYLAVALKEQGMLPEAVLLFDRVLEERPGDMMTHFHLGATHLRVGNTAVGLQHMRDYERLKRRLASQRNGRSR